MLVGIVDQLIKHALAVVGHEHISREQGGDRLKLTLGLGVVALESAIEIDRQKAALGPTGPFGQHRHRARNDEHITGWIVAAENLTHGISGDADLFVVGGTFDRVDQLNGIVITGGAEELSTSVAKCAPSATNSGPVDVSARWAAVNESVSLALASSSSVRSASNPSAANTTSFNARAVSAARVVPRPSSAPPRAAKNRRDMPRMRTRPVGTSPSPPPPTVAADR